MLFGARSRKRASPVNVAWQSMYFMDRNTLKFVFSDSGSSNGIIPYEVHEPGYSDITGQVYYIEYKHLNSFKSEYKTLVHGLLQIAYMETGLGKIPEDEKEYLAEQIWKLTGLNRPEYIPGIPYGEYTEMLNRRYGQAVKLVMQLMKCWEVGIEN